MSQHLLVSPVHVGRPGVAPRLLERVLPALTRTGATVSRNVFGGRAVGLGCTLAADMLGEDGRISFALGGGGSFGVRTDDRYWLPYLLLERSYETDLDHFLSRALTKADALLDCGANLGLWSIAAARVIGDPRRVVAVEASSRTFAQLKRNWSDNDGSFTIHHCALGTTSGQTVSFYASAGDHASATLVQSLSPQDAEKETVTTISLTDLIAEQERLAVEEGSLIFAKLDIEGMERDVIATLDPARNDQLLLLYEDHGSLTDHVTRYVLECGFLAAFLADDGSVEAIRARTLDRLDALKTELARGYNLLAYAPGGRAAARMAKLFGLPAD